MKQKLRIGVLIDDHNIPAWAFKMLEKINNSNHSEIVLIVRNQKALDKKSSLLSKLWDHKNEIFWILYMKLENILFNPNPNAFEQKKIGEVAKCDELIVVTESKKSSEYFTASDIVNIKSYELDVLLNLCFSSLKGDILTSANYGVWSYCHGDRSINRGGPSGLWEVFNQIDITGVFLEVMSEEVDEGKILARTYSSTEKLSIRRNRNNYYWKALSLVPRKLNELYNYGEVKFIDNLKIENNGINFFYNKISGKPRNGVVLKAFYKIYKTKLYHSFTSLFYFNQWIILYKFKTKKKWSNKFYEFERMTPPKDRFWADPFVLEKNNKYYIFLEELVYSEKLGKISVAEIDENGNFTPPITILKKDYHLSYPFLIEDNNELYMIPESSGDKSIQLYKCIDFPLKWELSKILMNNVCAVDSTIFKYDDKYWLFCNIKENNGASSLDELFLFYSESLHNDDWSSHPCNPIISDVRQSRPAGQIFIEKGKIFRPCQNSAKHYGYGMRINEILELTTTTYREKTVQSIYPNWENDLISTHTLNHKNKLTVIDALIRVRK